MSTPITNLQHSNNPTLAQLADRHQLYQKSVQDPATEIEFLQKHFLRIRGHKPSVLREDFCGTAYLTTAWCKVDAQHQGIGVDLCQDTLNWGRQNNLASGSSALTSRVSLVNANVIEYFDASCLADIICAFNFSYNILNTRQLLLDYFRNVYRGLKNDGLFVMDVFGGTETYSTVEEATEIEDENFTYIWDQDKFNPITHEMTCFIHFEFPDGSRLEKAFSYEWRLRTMPELIETLQEAGFSRVRCLWEEFVASDDDDENYEQTGEYHETSVVENQESWVAYLIAEK